jgi:DNA polymerase III epsilon subunit-like protein
MLNRNEETEDLARWLEATGDYRILRRLLPQRSIARAAGCGSKVGIIVDLETTGLDAKKDEIIEVAMVKFRYSTSGQVAGVVDTFQAFNQPSSPISREIIKLTGITDEMVTAKKSTMLHSKPLSLTPMSSLPTTQRLIENSRKGPGPCLETCTGLARRTASTGNNTVSVAPS